jgi:spore coat protein YutH
MEERAWIESEWGFRILECKREGAHTALYTDRGLFYLYTAPVGYKYKNRFIERVKKHLKGQKDIHLLKVERTENGKPYVVHEEQIYYLYRGIREAEPVEGIYAYGQALASFHQSTATFTGDRLFLPYSSLGSWPAMWRKKLRQYSAFQDDLEIFDGEITPFDEYLLTTYTYVNHLGDTAVQYLHDAGYQKVVKETAGCGKVAYQNFDEGYILFNEDCARYVGGEWNWVIDMRARDIGQWIKADVRRNGWREDAVIQFLDGYNSVCPLLPSEYAVVYALLLYPGRFLKLVETYRALPVEERIELDSADWQEQLEDELAKMEQALRSFPLTVCKQYGVSFPLIDWLWRPDDDETGCETVCVCDQASSC